jgi:hypothetical protein
VLHQNSLSWDGLDRAGRGKAASGPAAAEAVGCVLVVVQVVMSASWALTLIEAVDLPIAVH